MTKPTIIWEVFGGRYYGRSCSHYFFTRKKDAEKTLRADGYKYNKKEKLFLNDKIEEWRRIDERRLRHDAIVGE